MADKYSLGTPIIAPVYFIADQTGFGGNYVELLTQSF